MNRRLLTTLVLACVLVPALALTIAWALSADPVATLRRHGTEIERVERIPAPELGDRVERWRMITAAGDTLGALWRAAVPGAAHPWTVVLLGGLAAGQRAALLVPDGTRSHVLAVDWPWRAERRMPWWRILFQLGAIRHALLRAPAVVALGVEAAARADEVDPERIALAGVSLGVPPAVAALRLTQRPAAVALLHGGAGLRQMLHHALVREGVPGLLAGPLSALGSAWIRPLEPALHAAAISGRRALVINAEADPFLPQAGVERLHRLLPAADVRWRQPLHGAADRQASIAAITNEVQGWLDSE